MSVTNIRLDQINDFNCIKLGKNSCLYIYFWCSFKFY